MPEQPETRVAIRTFPGLVTNADPHDLPVGTLVEAENISTTRHGELSVRPGMRKVEFDS